MLEVTASRGAASDQLEEYEDASECIQDADTDVTCTSIGIIQVACLSLLRSNQAVVEKPMLVHCPPS